MTKRELTDRNDDAARGDWEITWRGFPYFSEVEGVLPDSFEGGEDITSSQRCWVGYLPSTDEFLVGFDIWLENRSEDPDDVPMAGGFAWVRLTITDGAIHATTVKSERFSEMVYYGALEVIRSRLADVVEIDID